MPYTDYIGTYFQELRDIIDRVEHPTINEALKVLQKVKKAQGRLFILGVGGSAANASHAVNDFRKISGIEAYTPIDNVAELTAWANDNGWEYTFPYQFYCYPYRGKSNG